MSSVINGGMPPKILPLGEAQAGHEPAGAESSQRFAPGSVSQQPAALSQFSGDAEALVAIVGRLKAMSSPVRSSLVTELKQSVASGSYSPDAAKVADAVAKALANG